MRKFYKTSAFIYVALISALLLMSGCGGKTNFLSKGGVPLRIEAVNPTDVNPAPPGGGGGGGTAYQDIPSSSSGGLYPIFSGVLGMPISYRSLTALAPDQSGYTAVTDYDGDGIGNEEEEFAFTNEYVSEVPRITTRIDTPVTMELRVSETDITQNHSELVSDTDVKNTINNSMESRQYNQLNQKTTPYVTKESSSSRIKDAGSNSFSMAMEVEVKAAVVEAKFGYNQSRNRSWDRELAQSSMSEKTVFEDVNYMDNLNRNGVEFKDDTVQRIAKNFRESAVSKSTMEIGPNAGFVRAGLYIANESRNQPVRISNVICTLSFRTPSGKCLPVKTFRLRNDDYSEFDQEIYGGQELGPYTIEVTDLNTFEVKNALRSGYIPQISVVNYDMHRVEDSNYNPGVDNLKIVEETAKARTALVKITGNGARETYRVPAFDVDSNNNISPGLSLKKALFWIYRDRTGHSESWDQGDLEGKSLTVPDTGLKWRADFDQGNAADGEYRYDPGVESLEITGNTWRMFSTYLKTYAVMDRGSDGKLVERTKRIETIERIGALKKYNPFTTEDNPAYDPNEPLSLDEFYKMKYWVILHNGRYYEGDINDPIWAGERYEIILFDCRDFNEHFKTEYYAPLNQGTERDVSAAIGTQADFYVNTLWNKDTNNKGNFSRAMYLGKIIPGDVVKLDVELEEFRSLFDVSRQGKEFGPANKIRGLNGKMWYQFNYTFDSGDALPVGIPANFTYKLWGGTNSIDLWIEESANARFYTATFWKKGETDAQTAENEKLHATTAYISTDNVAENQGFVSINRNTPRHTRDLFTGDEVPGDPIGLIEAAEYRVKVRAHGVVNNVLVSTLSGNAAAEALVSDPPTTETLPSIGTSMWVSTAMNYLTVTIEQADNAEFYFIDVIGPLNYGHGNGELEGHAPPVNRINGHAGINIIPIPNPNENTIGRLKELTTDEENLAAPGVYRVAVYPVNRSCYDAPGDPEPNPADVRPLTMDPASALVEYNRYEDQRHDNNANLAFSPKRQFEEFGPKNVDLEVNFNDGSGWFRLKLAHDDVGEEDRSLDCRYTTSFVKDRGRVSIYFTPPTGPLGTRQNLTHNVFRGGAREVDLYLRTAAKPEYRDSLWLKRSGSSTFNSSKSRCIYVNSEINTLPNCDPLKYWIGRPETDVTAVEDYAISNRVFSNLAELNTVAAQNTIGENDFGVIAKDRKNDLFFSPMRNLTYKISASLVEADIDRMMTSFTHTDNPQYRALGGEYRIELSNLDTQYGENFNISVARADAPSVALYTWNDLSIASPLSHTLPIISGETNPAGQLINLAPNTEYLVTMIASNCQRNASGSCIAAPTYSSKVIKSVKTIAEAEEVRLDDPNLERDAEQGRWYGHGYGSFLDPAQPLTDEFAYVFREGVDYRYGEPLNADPYNLYDTGPSDIMETGRFFRIVDNGKNVAYSAGLGGLGLTPIAMDLSRPVSPPNNQCYIDPAAGAFMLPRPIYWSRCESWANMRMNPEIKAAGFDPTHYPAGSSFAAEDFTSQKFGYGYHNRMFVEVGGNPIGTRYFLPFGNNALDWRKGTLSVWITSYVVRSADWGDAMSNAVQCFITPNNTSNNFSMFTNLYHHTNGTYINTLNVEINHAVVYTGSLIGNGTRHHLYVVWDSDKGLSGGSSWRAYLDGAFAADGVQDIPGVLASSVFTNYHQDNVWASRPTIFGHAWAQAETSFDNLKIWSHVVSEDPAWEFQNSYEDGLHPIYGATNRYRPVLTKSNDGNPTNDGGVGFYYIPKW